MFKTYTSSAAGGGASPISAPPGQAQGWHPTVLYMLGLVVAEIVLVGLLSRYLLK